MNDITRLRCMWICVVLIAGVLLLSAKTEAAYGASVKENSRGISVVHNLGNGSDGNAWKNPHYNNSPQYMYTIKTGGEEKYGYCFQTGKRFLQGVAYTAKRPANASAWTNLSASRQRIIRLALYYGYNNGKSVPISGANKNDYFAATQVLVWEAADGDVTLSDEGKWGKSSNKHDNLIEGRTKATQCYNWIKSQIAKHVKGPSFGAKTQASAKTYTMKYDYSTGVWSVVLTDTLKGNYYKLGSSSTGAMKMSRNGYRYTFTSASAGTKKAVLINSDSDGTSQELMVFRPSDSGNQAIIIGSTDTVQFYSRFRTENTGTGVIVKKTSDGSSSAGFSFLVENKANGYSKVHVTDEEGKITLELYPGKYTVTELLTEKQKAAGFNTPVGGVLEITESGNTKLTLNNVRKEVPYQIRKTSDNEVVDGFEFVITGEDGNEIHRQKTDNRGIIEGKLYPGKYIIREELTDHQLSEGYRAARPRTLEITEEQAGTQIISFHNKWEPIEGKLAIRKTTDDQGPEGGFMFEIEGTIAATGEKYYRKDCATDETGQYMTEEMEPGTYTITEILTEEQNKRYETPEPQIVEINDSGQGAIVNFKNKAKRTRVVVKKTCEEGMVQGVEFAIKGTLAWGDEFSEIVRATDENGNFTIDLQPGTYTFTEIGQAAEKSKPQPPRKITVTGEEPEPVEVNFINILNSISFTKTEALENGTMTDTPVAGAIYQVYRQDEYKGHEVQVDYGRFTTDKNGSFFVKGVVPGKYYFREVYAPIGYIINENPIEVDFTENDVGIEIKDLNRRAYGTITVIIKDNQRNPVEATQMELYIDSQCTISVGSYVTDETGRFKIDGLPWGDYYLKETESTRGYEDNKEIRHINIGKDGVIDAECQIIKEQKRGRILISKTDETETLCLESAEFSLYKTDGTMVYQGLTTDNKGQILVEGLEWGSYYFKETTAPEGYSLKSDPVRFSVNATTGGVLQELTVANEAETSHVIISKKIKAEDLHYDHGVPSFTFKLSGTTVDGEEKEYSRQVIFSKKYVSENLQSDGYVAALAVFDNLKSGEYTCTEKETIRYQLTGISDVSSNGIVNEQADAVTFKLKGLDSGQATFVNEKTDWQDFSDSVSITNIIKAEKKLTSIAVEYLGSEILDGNMPFDSNKYLEITAFYDDGSERALATDEYKLINGDGTVFDRTDKTAGVYTVTVLYSEGNISRKGSFTFRIEGAEQFTVSFETNGGTALEPLSVWKYDTLSDYSDEHTCTDRIGYNFTGWYTDEELTKPFTETDLIIESMNLYAGWYKKHLNDFSWQELQEMSESGTAQQFLGECFEVIQEDLADDGIISTENYIHSKSFDCQGKICHAVIAGFDHDEKSDGSETGISFLVYEPLEAKAMITSGTGRSLGWNTCYMRNTVLTGVYENLPEAMKSVICPVKKMSIVKSGNSVSVQESSDTLWIPSQVELYGAWGYDTWNPEALSGGYVDNDYGRLRSVAGEGKQYDLFRGFIPDGVSATETALTYGTEYWTRSVDPSLDRGFCFVNPTGAADSK